MALFIIKIIIAVLGFAFALANGVKYMETKNKASLCRAAFFFFGMWMVLILIKVFEVWFYKH